MRSILSRLILCLLLSMPVAYVSVSTVACGPQAVNVTPQAAVAHYGADIVSGLLAYQRLIVTATEATPPVLTVAQATPQMDKIRAGLTQAEALSTLLKQYDALTAGAAKSALVPQIQAALTALSTLGLDAATLPAALVAQGTQLVSSVNTLIASAKAAVVTGGL